jgi:general secretion pathway protein G
MKMRKGGFTLVELLIVIVIIAILAGMTLLSAGSATDLAEAMKVINDLRNLKSAALLYYGDHLKWPDAGDEASLDYYSDRPVVNASPKRYGFVTIGPEYDDAQGKTRANIGVGLIGGAAGSGVQKKLAAKAADTGLLAAATSKSQIYATGTTVYMNMR